MTCAREIDGIEKCSNLVECDATSSASTASFLEHLRFHLTLLQYLLKLFYYIIICGNPHISLASVLECHRLWSRGKFELKTQSPIVQCTRRLAASNSQRIHCINKIQNGTNRPNEMRTLTRMHIPFRISSVICGLWICTIHNKKPYNLLFRLVDLSLSLSLSLRLILSLENYKNKLSDTTESLV